MTPETLQAEAERLAHILLDRADGGGWVKKVYTAAQSDIIALVTRAVREERERCDRLEDSQYVAGAQFGWNCGVSNAQETFRQAIDARTIRERK